MSRHRIIVSEPWDFHNSHGHNEIFGEIIKRIDDRNLIMKTDVPININNANSDILILSLRYQGDIFNDNEPFHGTINGGLLLSKNYKNKTALKLQEESTFLIIGELKTVSVPDT